MNTRISKNWAESFYKQNPVKFVGLDKGLWFIIDKVLPTLAISSEAKVLDVGCGDGRVLRGLKKAFPLWKLYGVDISQPNIKALLDEGFDVQLVDVSSEALPYQDDYFDLVLLFDVVEHLVDPDWALTQIRKVVRRNGFVLIKTPNLAFWINRIILLLGLQPLYTEVSTHKVVGRKYTFLGQGNQVVGHLRIFTKPALVDFVEYHGFKIVKILGLPENRLPLPLMILDRIISRRASMSTQLLAILKKRIDTH